MALAPWSRGYVLNCRQRKWRLAAAFHLNLRRDPAVEQDQCNVPGGVMLLTKGVSNGHMSAPAARRLDHMIRRHSLQGQGPITRGPRGAAKKMLRQMATRVKCTEVAGTFTRSGNSTAMRQSTHVRCTAVLPIVRTTMLPFSAGKIFWRQKQNRGSSEIAFHFRECKLDSAAPQTVTGYNADIGCTGLLIAPHITIVFGKIR